MSVDLLNVIAKYVIALVTIIGCLILVFTGRGDQTQPWLVVGLVIGWIIRDNAGSAATSNAVKTIAAATPS